MFNKRACVVDIETNNLLSNMVDFSSLPYKLKKDARLWCIVVRNIQTDEVFTLKGEKGNEITKEDVKEVLSGYDEIIAHNGIKFDFITLKLFGVLDYEIGYLNQPDLVFGKEVKFTDTLVRSRLFNPDRKGGHSLDAWGKFLGEYKGDFKNFHEYSEEMVDYCIQDTKVTKLIYQNLLPEWNAYPKWEKPEKLENKLADLAVRRESYGFWFDKELAVNCVEDLTEKMDKLQANVNPLLPPKPLTKAELKNFTPPAKQFKQDKTFTTHMENFVKKHDLDVIGDCVEYKGKVYPLPLTEPLEITRPADISDLDHVKQHLINLGWNPSEWKVRDLTKDSKKQNITYEKRVKAFETWCKQTFEEGKYTKHRLKELGMKSEKEVRDKILPKLKQDKPVRVPTSPMVRVGVEKELCPNLVKLGDKVAFANDFTLYLTYKHRKSSIAGGDIEDMDFDEEVPNTGFLAMYRDVDGRIPTPSIEIGASTNRYRHIGVCNIARASSIYGEQMRSLFGCGSGMRQLGFDFSSLEARIQGHYILPFDGEELAEQLLASKPNDIHSINARKIGIPRDQAKGLGYALIYGAHYTKLKSMLGVSEQEAKAIYDAYWDAVAPLKKLRDAVNYSWERRGKKFIIGVDGRKINTRSQHSLLNALFQSGGVICAKYATVFIFQLLEENGLRCNPFESDVDVCGMIEYHDECQLAVKPNLIPLKKFENEDEANEFINEWDGEQLGSISYLANGKPCVAMPNVVSQAITKAIDMAVEEVKLKVPLGMEWVVHKNWYGCH